MFAVGMDVSNGKSIVTVLRSKTQFEMKPFEVAHTADGLAGLVEKLKALDGICVQLRGREKRRREE